MILRALVLVLLAAAPAQAATLEIGLTDSPGGAKALRHSAPFGYRYQYLAGGWPTWNPDGSFVTLYVRESVAAHITPVFTLYTIRQSPPGRDIGDEAKADLGNLANRETMKAWYDDARLLFKRAGAFKTRVIVHVEPDLWGYVQQAAAKDDAATVPAVVASSGDPDLAGIPNNVAGFAQAVVRLRDKYAKNVVLGYHLSVWGTKTDIALQNPPDKQVDALGRRAARFYRSLHARYDMTFAEFSDRDSAFKQLVYGDGGASWWNAADFRRDVRVQWLLGSAGGRKHLRAYRDAGVIALLFGGGAGGTTCACDGQKDGVTNPPPKHGNTRRSISADDDGGYFRQRVRRYYKGRGAIRLR